MAKTGTYSFRRFAQSWVINTLAVLVAVYVVRGLTFKDDSLWTPFVVALVLGILNSFIRPIIMFLALPLLIFTLGLFMLVINAALLYLVGLILGDYFQVHNFGSAFLGALIISVVSAILNIVTGTNRATVKVRRAPRKQRDDDVIDI
jgi:putative membrane protein